MSSIINKVKDVLSGHNADKTTDTTSGTAATTDTVGNTSTIDTTGTAEGVAGPHSSRLANTLDPRVDSDMDGSGRVGATTGTSDTTGMTGNTYTSGARGTSEGVAGPHSSRIANAMDPRVDSDMDGSGRINTTTGTTGMASNNYTTGTTGMTDNNYATGTTGTTGMTGGDNYTTATTGNTGGQGPHSSSLLNKLDPHVDSTTGAMNTSGSTGTGMTGNTRTYTTDPTDSVSDSTNAGPHGSNLANKMDPRVDSDMDDRGNRTGAATGGVFGAASSGQGTAQNTTGPHNSDILNKLDPRVDSSMDNRTAMGGNQTYAGSESRNPLDAAHVTPSVLRESLGDPVIAHDNPEHNHQGRHASMSHQEAHIHRGSENF